MAAAAKTFTAEFHRWPNGSYGLVVSESPDPDGLDPLAVFRVTTTSKARVAGEVVAYLLNPSRSTHAVWRIR